MKGHIILPTFYYTRWTDDYKHLLMKISTEFNFKIEYSNNPKIDKDTDVVILFATPHHMRPDDLMELADLHENIRLIGFMKDIQHYDKPEVIKNIKKMFDRYDVILSPSYEYFEQTYPEHMDKMVYVPDFFGPYERYDLDFVLDPIIKCLVSGAVNPDVYPLRQYILNNGDGEYLDYLPSPVTGHDIIHDKYAQFLNKYLCCATCSSIFNYTLAKYHEIPASGSLLLANQTNDLDRIGYRPFEHYIPVDETNVIDTIKDVVYDPNAYTKTRIEGMEYARKNHSIINRAEQIGRIIKSSM